MRRPLGKCRKKGRCENLCRGLLLQGSQAFHQTALAPGGVVLMENAFFSRFIQCAYRHAGGLNCLFQRAFLNDQARFLDKRARPPLEIAVAQTPLFVLSHAFNL